MQIDHAPKIKLLNFLVKDIHMCAYLNNVEKVLPLVALEHVPGAPSYLVGLMNMKGKIIPVIDLAMLLSLVREKKYTLDIPILLLSNKQKEVAVIVDNILGLTEIEITQLQMSNEFEKNDSPYLASITHDSDSSLLININYFLEIDLIKDDNVYGIKKDG